MSGPDSADYRFGYECTFAADPQRVLELLVDLEHYPLWWPQVRAVASIDADHGLVVCRSVLPYDLELVLTAISRDLPVVEVGIEGPINGFARWQVSPDGDGSRLRFEQQVRAHGVLGAASYLLKPVLRWNHQVMMRGFEEGARKALESGVSLG